MTKKPIATAALRVSRVLVCSHVANNVIRSTENNRIPLTSDFGWAVANERECHLPLLVWCLSSDTSCSYNITAAATCMFACLVGIYS